MNTPLSYLISKIFIKTTILTYYAYAKWDTYNYVVLKTEFYNKHLIINKDGTSQDNNRNLGTAIKEILW